MKNLNEIYDICRDYVHDQSQAGLIDPATEKTLTGWIRSRSLEKLASASELLDRFCIDQGKWESLLQVEAFFKKNDHFADDTVCLERAKTTFRKGEVRCSITNKRLDWYYVHRDRLDPDMNLYLSRMERFCSNVLGPFEPFLDNLPRLVRLTSGATATRSRASALPYLKVGKRLTCTSGAGPYLQALSDFYGYGKLALTYREENRVEFVPKNWKTHRTIACEQDGNIPLQLAFDRWAKRRLRLKTPVNLADQSLNQSAAKHASIFGDFATIDLSAASDSLAFNTVAWFIPQPWFEYLNRIRSSFYRLDGHTYLYSKFSSMGNGTTFPLETLIFAAACHAVGSRTYNVYGDDIVIETQHVNELIRVLRFIGFAVNEEKSYTAGPFRESCGGNFLRGVDITPHYVRGNAKLRPELCHLINGLASRCIPGGALSERLLQMTVDYHLPVVPFNEDTMSGVFVDISTAWDMKLIKQVYDENRRPTWTYRYRAYKSKGGTRVVQDSRSLFLWHLNAQGRGALEPGAYLSVTEVPTLDHRYRRKWVKWTSCPLEASTGHLSWWSERLMSLLKHQSH